MNTEIDLTYLKSVSNGDAAFELSMIQSLTAEVEEKIEKARACLTAFDAGGLRLQAHSLKNLFAILGIETLRKECLSIESNCDAGFTEPLSSQLLTCEVEWQEKKKILALLVAAYESNLQAS